MRKNSSADNDRCPFPGCEADSWHEGDHDFGKRTEEPTGELQVLQKLCGKGPASPFCEFHPGTWAIALLGNKHGHAWLVCDDCLFKYTGDGTVIRNLVDFPPRKELLCQLSISKTRSRKRSGKSSRLRTIQSPQ